MNDFHSITQLLCQHKPQKLYEESEDVNNIELLSYMNWADDIIFGHLSSLDYDIYQKEPSDRMGTIHSILKHIAEEMVAWLADLQDLSFKSKYEAIQEMGTLELVESIRHSHGNWKSYLSHSPKDQYSIDEGEGLIVEISLDEVIFNLVNHGSYHRGQIAKILRNNNISLPITDYYWYKISQQSK